jgi:hypothetical protein
MSPRTRTARAVLLAIAVGGAPVLQMSNFLTHPEVPATGAGLLELVARDPGGWFRIHAIAAASAVLSIVSAMALASLVRRRGAVLATVGAALATVGGGMLAIAFGAEAHLASLAADPSLDRAAMSALLDLEPASPATALLMAGFPVSGIGSLLVAVALLRSRAVPRWLPALVLLGLVASIFSAPGSHVGPLLLAPAVVGYLGLAREVVRAARRSPADADVQAPPAEREDERRPHPELSPA